MKLKDTYFRNEDKYSSGKERTDCKWYHETEQNVEMLETFDGDANEARQCAYVGCSNCQEWINYHYGKKL